MMNLQILALKFTLKWMIVCTIVGAIVGSASAFFLVWLDWATHYREQHTWIIAFLPIAGWVVGSLYYYWGADIAKGNNQLIEELQQPQSVISLKMMPFILLTTVITHLFGGSAGREGTAVQMGGALADQVNKWNRWLDNVFFLKKLSLKNLALDNAEQKLNRKIILLAGISAGFASVFGTPLAGTVFALEVAIIGKMRYEAILPSLLSAVVADYVCQDIWHVGHTHYFIAEIPKLLPQTIIWSILAGLCFGLMGLFFAQITHFWSNIFKNKIAYPPLRPVIAGSIIAILVWSLGSQRYIGLGVPVIVESFTQPLPVYDFLAKTFFTSLTLGAGFKGGEVTPLFYIGATLGNTLAHIIPLPVSLLAGMGFVGVFSGASNTPLACTLMGIELFGIEAGVYIAIACIVAYVFSGTMGIYASQVVGVPKVARHDTDYL